MFSPVYIETTQTQNVSMAGSGQYATQIAVSATGEESPQTLLLHFHRNTAFD